MSVPNDAPREGEAIVTFKPRSDSYGSVDRSVVSRVVSYHVAERVVIIVTASGEEDVIAVDAIRFIQFKGVPR